MSRAEPVENVHDDNASQTIVLARFKAQTVELVRTSGKSVAEVCRDLDLTETAVRRWVAQAEIDAGQDGSTWRAQALRQRRFHLNSKMSANRKHLELTHTWQLSSGITIRFERRIPTRRAGSMRVHWA